MDQFVRLPIAIIAAARREADRNNRSVTDQIIHWLEIGRATEQSCRFDNGPLKMMPAGCLDNAHLTEIEKAA